MNTFRRILEDPQACPSLEPFGSNNTDGEGGHQRISMHSQSPLELFGLNNTEGLPINTFRRILKGSQAWPDLEPLGVNDTEGGPSTHFDAFLKAPRPDQASNRLA